MRNFFGSGPPNFSFISNLSYICPTQDVQNLNDVSPALASFTVLSLFLDPKKNNMFHKWVHLKLVISDQSKRNPGLLSSCELKSYGPWH